MKRASYFLAAFFAGIWVSDTFVLRAEEKPVKLVPVLKINRELDKRTVIRNIEPGMEIWASYGPYYDYDQFMNALQVRDFFCGRLNIDCQETFAYDP